MPTIKVPKKPKYCPRCGGKLVAIGNREGSYTCEDCKQKVQVLSFPRNANKLALDAINEGRVEYPFLNVEYSGVYKNMLVYEPGVMKDCCWDGITHIFVKQNGKVIISDGEKPWDIIHAMDDERCKIESFRHTEKFYRIAAKRCIKGEDYYDGVKADGFYEGKRVYTLKWKKEYLINPLPIGLPMFILVDENGKAQMKECLGFSKKKGKWEFL